MDDGCMPFQLGRVRCIALSDGSISYPLGHMFAGIPKGQVEEALRSHNLPVDFVTTPCTCLLIETGEHRVLVDLGADRLMPNAGQLLRSLAAAGIAPTQIDTVVITHAHPAHVGGALDLEGGLIYTAARYFIGADEWAFWTSAAAYRKASERHVAIARASLEPLRDHLTLLSEDSEVAPGVRVIAAPGHTPGHRVVSISSGRERLLYIGDAVMHVLHLEHPDWPSIYDTDPEQAQEIRRRFLSEAADEGALVMGHHLSLCPSLGYVARIGAGWRWEPLVTV